MRKDFETVLTLLAEKRIRFLVVGGVAVVLHGFLRMTGDLDLVIDFGEDNLSRALETLEEGGFRPRAPVPLSDFADPKKRAEWIEEKNMKVFSLWHGEMTGFEVDIFLEPPFDFTEVWTRAPRVSLGKGEIRVVPLDDLIEMKRTAGRPKDEEDIRALSALHEKK